MSKYAARDEAIASLHVEHGWSFSQIAAVYGITRGAVAGVVYRYRRRSA